jgi:hypothetical protein
VHEGYGQAAGQIGRLIEPARYTAHGMERNRDHARGALEQIASGLPQHLTEPRRDRSAPVVLERMDDAAKGPFVPTG